MRPLSSVAALGERDVGDKSPGLGCIQVALEQRAQADEVHSNGLAVASVSVAGMLDRVGVDGEVVKRAMLVVGIVAGQDLAEQLPAPGVVAEVGVSGAVDLGDQCPAIAEVQLGRRDHHQILSRPGDSTRVPLGSTITATARIDFSKLFLQQDALASRP